MIEGKVAKVLNSREIAINRGREHGVELGMTFAVLDDSGANVTDPDTNETLGSVYREKARVRIVGLQDQLSVGRTYESVPGRSGFDMTNLFLSTPSRPKTLGLGDAEFEPIDEENSIVKRGDLIRQLQTRSEAVARQKVADQAESWVLDLERQAGHTPTLADQRDPGGWDIASDGRFIEVKAFSEAASRSNLTEQVRRFLGRSLASGDTTYLYIVENVDQGGEALTLRVIPGEDLKNLSGRLDLDQYPPLTAAQAVEGPLREGPHASQG